MKLKELIQELQRIEDDYGNIPVDIQFIDEEKKYHHFNIKEIYMFEFYNKECIIELNES